MKIILLLGVVTLLICQVGCRTHEPAVSAPIGNPNPVNFDWIRSSEKIKMATADIYFHGTAHGKYVGNEKWVGQITGNMFFKPKDSKCLTDGLFVDNCTVQVNEDYSIKITKPQDTFFATAKKITFEDGEVAVWYPDNTFRFKFKVGSFFHPTTLSTDESPK